MREMSTNNPKTLLLTGLVGSAVTAICCFTPVLVFLLGLLGLSAVVGYLDYVLLPVLGGFGLLIVYGLIRAKRNHRCDKDGT